MPALGGTTALLLLCVFTVVNVAVLVLRKDTVEHKHFRTPTILPMLGAICCAFLAGPWTGRDPVQYKIAGILIATSASCCGSYTVLVNRAYRGDGKRSRMSSASAAVAPSTQSAPEAAEISATFLVVSRAFRARRSPTAICAIIPRSTAVIACAVVPRSTVIGVGRTDHAPDPGVIGRGVVARAVSAIEAGA